MLMLSCVNNPFSKELCFWFWDLVHGNGPLGPTFVPVFRIKV